MVRQTKQKNTAQIFRWHNNLQEPWAKEGFLEVFETNFHNSTAMKHLISISYRLS